MYFSFVPMLSKQIYYIGKLDIKNVFSFSTSKKRKCIENIHEEEFYITLDGDAICVVSGCVVFLLFFSMFSIESKININSPL